MEIPVDSASLRTENGDADGDDAGDVVDCCGGCGGHSDAGAPCAVR